MTANELARKVRDILDDKKGEAIRLLDIHELSSLADIFIVVTGNSAPHLKGLFNAVQRGLKEEGIRAFRASAEPDSRWLVLDYLDVVIHIFDQESRTYYGIEDLWKEAPEIALPRQ